MVEAFDLQSDGSAACRFYDIDHSDDLAISRAARSLDEDSPEFQRAPIERETQNPRQIITINYQLFWLSIDLEFSRRCSSSRR